VLLCLYCAIICSIDYSNFIYISASKSKLFMLDPIHNAGIWLAIGAFHISCLASN